ncbi:MAG TPA: methyltransferase domain-containing protein [Baekduia sp.]|uniref:class I SAM-dependent methyltransferase n=1 Tax=Baekduia sp. TaxID=2600305 RepID=UPI002D77505E|nr:methyltransferase domain-containing protein [Baekduia sp.]HET6505738.1 methyltransferase domain-containing protein [Baekduia sp.]
MAADPQEMLDAFFGDFYLRVYGSRQAGDEARDQASAAARLAGCPEGGALLDVACGFGRHAVPLAAAGFRVTGVDRSATLLDEARRRAGDASPTFVAADYRELPFADASFDAAINLYTSIGFLGDEEDTKVLAEVARVLRPGGRLVVESMHRDLMIRIFQERGWRLLGAGRLLLEQRAFDPVTGVVQETQTLIGSDGARESQAFSTRVYTATELMAMLRAAGFDKVTAYGDLDGAPFDVGTRLVLVARTPV